MFGFLRSDDPELDEPMEHVEERKVYTITYTDETIEKVYADRMFEDIMIQFYHVTQMEINRSKYSDNFNWIPVKERIFVVNEDEVRSIDIGDTISEQTFRGSTEGIYDPIED